MSWDKSWVQLPKIDVKYREGCQEFVELAFRHAALNGKLRCPCKHCRNKKFDEKDNVLFHLLTKGWDQDYATEERWYLHNEPRPLPPTINPNKKYLKIDALDGDEGVDPLPRRGPRPVSGHAYDVGQRLSENYEAAIASGSDKSTASTQAVLQTFGRVTRPGLHVDVPRETRTTKRDAYTVLLEQKVVELRQQVVELRQQSEAQQRHIVDDRHRIASLEAQMADFMARFGGQSGGGGASGFGDHANN